MARPIELRDSANYLITAAHVGALLWLEAVCDGRVVCSNKVDASLSGGAWSAQELLKGTGVMYLLPRVRREGGWGFNPVHTVPLSQNGELLKTEYTDEEMVTSPPFLPFAEDWLHSTNAVTSAQVAEVRDRILADGIPALTFAAGANPVDVFGDAGNYNYQNENGTPNGWPSERQKRQGDVMVDTWLHSDIKDVAFYYVHKFFEKITKGE